MPKPSVFASPILWLIACLLLAACSTTDYKPAVTTFADATTQASDALMALRQATLQAQLDAGKQALLAGKAVPDIRDGDCIADSRRCRLVMLHPDGTTSPLTASEGLDTMAGLAVALSAYARNLGSIVDADTASAVSANLSATEGSILSTVAAANKLPGVPIDAAAIKAVADPATGLISAVAADTINRLQIDALRRATAQADPAIQKIAAYLGGEMKFNFAPLRAANNTLQQSLTAYENDPHNAAKLDALLAAAKAYDQKLRATHSTVFADLATAHAALTNQLAGKVSLAQAAAAIGDFATRASALLTLAKQLRSAAAPQP